MAWAFYLFIFYFPPPLLSDPIASYASCSFYQKLLKTNLKVTNQIYIRKSQKEFEISPPPRHTCAARLKVSPNVITYGGGRRNSRGAAYFKEYFQVLNYNKGLRLRQQNPIALKICWTRLATLQMAKGFFLAIRSEVK